MASTSTRTVQHAPDLPSLLACALRYRWACLIVGCLFAVVGVAASRFIPAQFKATALIRLSAPQGVVDQPHESSNAQREFRHTQKEMLQMPHVLRGAIETPEILELDEIGAGPDAAEDVADLVEVELPRSSEIMRVSVSHDDAETAYLLVNAVIRSYLDELQRTDSEERERRLATLQRLHGDSEERLNKAWRALQTLARQVGAGDPAALSLQTQAEIENYRAYSRLLRTLRSQKRDADRQVRAIKDESGVLAEEMPEKASMHSVKFAMFTAKLKREKALMQWGPGHPDVVTAKQEEDLLREFYQKAGAESEREPRNRKEEMLAEPLATLARLEHEETALESMLAEIEDRLELLGGDNAAKLEILRNEVSRIETSSARLWQTRENLQVERHADHRVQLVSLATLPTKRDTSKREKLSLVLAGGGFGFAVVALALGEFLTGRVHSRRDVVTRSGIELYGTSRPLPRTVRTQQVSGKSQVGESELDMLVAQLLSDPKLKTATTFLVTSASTRSERGYLFSHLAATLARTGKKTVLLDLDFRDERSVDGTPESASCGLAGFLAQPDRCSSPIQSFPDVPHLDVVRAGVRPTGPLPLLTGAALADFVAMLKQNYAYVVVDVAPVLKFPDAQHVRSIADAVVLGVQKNVSRAGDLLQARESLETPNVPLIGVFTS